MEKRTLVYVRVSGGPGQDTASQKRILREFVARKQLPNVEWLEDEIRSSKKSRPQYQKLCNLVKAGQVSCVVAYRYDRIGRTAKENLELAEWCQARGCNILGAADGGDLLGPNGKLIFTILSALAEREWEDISIRTKDGMAIAKAKGKCIGGSCGGITQRVKDEIPAIKDLLKAGRSRHYIAKRLKLNYKTVVKLCADIDGEWATRKEMLKRVPLAKRGKKYQQGVEDARNAQDGFQRR